MKELTNIQKTMSSREIAELTGKEHRNVLADCDKLNNQYQKMGLAEISAGVYTLPNTGQQQHRCYELTKMQTIDLMTGYNIELRIKINRRWEELEIKNNKIDFSDPNTVLQLAKNWAEEQEKRIAAENQLKIQEPKVQYVEKLLKSETTFSTTELAADFGMSAKRLNKELIHKKVIRKLREGYVLTSAYLGKGYEYMLPIEKEGASMRQLRWTERGRAFIHWKLGITKELNPTQGKLELK